jgi:hypothetical protein
MQMQGGELRDKAIKLEIPMARGLANCLKFSACVPNI